LVVYTAYFPGLTATWRFVKRTASRHWNCTVWCYNMTKLLITIFQLPTSPSAGGLRHDKWVMCWESRDRFNFWEI